MSVKVYIENWDQYEVKTNVYIDEFYPHFTPEEVEEYGSQDPFCKKDEDGRYILFQESVSIDNGVEFPSPEFSNTNFRHLMTFIDPKNVMNLNATNDFVSGDKLTRLHGLIMKRANGKAINSMPDDTVVSTGNVHEFVAGSEYTKRGCDKLLEAVTFAQSRGLGIYWA